MLKLRRKEPIISLDDLLEDSGRYLLDDHTLLSRKDSGLKNFKEEIYEN